MRWAWLALVLAAACQRSGKLEVERVMVRAVEGLDVLGRTQPDVEARVRELLAARRFALVDEPGPVKGPAGRWRLDVAIAAQEPTIGGAAEGRAAVAVSASQRGGAEPFLVSERARRKAKSTLVDDIQAAAREALDAALSEAFEQVHATVGLGALEEPKLVGKLSSGAAAEQRAALRLLVERRSPAALAPLVAQLSTKDEDELRRTMGQLVELGDPAAAKPLIEAAHHASLGLQRELLFALGSLGGGEAEAYLYMVSQGHEEPALRDAAARALEELRAPKLKRRSP